MKQEKKKFWSATSIFIGTCIGAGVLGIPYVAAQAGFFVALAYILLIGIIILFVNLYMGEIVLRTKGNHQLVGYAKRYLGEKGKKFMEFAFVFGIYAAIVAYMLGIGESISFLIFGDSSYTTLFGILFGAGMSGLLWGKMKVLKRYEKIGVSIILGLLFLIVILFFNKIEVANLMYFNLGNIFLPFGVILFAFLAFYSIPEVKIALGNKEKSMKKVLFTGTLVCTIFYILFALVVVGFKGSGTPEIATLVLGTVFVFLGIFAMFTSWLALGNALETSFMFDEKIKKRKAWLLASLIPILIFLIIRFFEFSFTYILSIGGVVSGGLAAILILLMIKKAKKKGNRKPEYSIPVNWFVIGFLILIFVLGVVRELWLVLR
ncbi:amino acid permease [Candidatus Pacearchaeota archaeon]|nr:amino acid permease [Candidatus Pacearchaeota archaeon]